MAAGYIGDGYVMITPYPWNSKAWFGLVSVSYNGSAVAAKEDGIFLHVPKARAVPAIEVEDAIGVDVNHREVIAAKSLDDLE